MNDNEIWQPVPNWEDYYSVSNYGRIKSHSRIIVTKNGSSRQIKGGISNSICKTNGYYSATLRKEGKSVTTKLHILVARTFIPNPGNKPFVNHIDGDRLNNNVGNLEWVTPLENIQHAWRIGLTKQNGSDSVLSKLTEEEVILIRRLYKSGYYTLKQIAEKIGKCHWGYIGLVIQGKRWTHVIDDEQPVKQCPVCGGLPSVCDNTCSFCTPRSNPSQDIPDYIKGIEDFPSGLQDITSKFIEQARGAENEILTNLFKQTTGEELTEQNAHRITIAYDERGALYDRHIGIDGHMIGWIKQDMEPTDNGYKCSITFVPYG